LSEAVVDSSSVKAVSVVPVSEPEAVWVSVFLPQAAKLTKSSASASNMAIDFFMVCTPFLFQYRFSGFKLRFFVRLIGYHSLFQGNLPFMRFPFADIIIFLKP
jgi:hypothetical protein